MKDINQDLVRMLYAKYSPNTDVDSKLEYIQQQYGDNQEEFVRNFYAKYEPNVDVDAKLEYISQAYPVKKKDETTELVSPQEEVVTTSVTEEVETPGVSDVSVSEEVVEEPIQGATKETPELPKYLQHAFESETEDKSFNEAIATVVIDDIDKDQEALVPELLEKFNKYGFSFQESSWLGDAITVYDYNGTPLEVDLQTFTSSGKQEEYNKLIQFLNNNRRDPKKIQEDLDVEAEDFKHLADREDKDTESSLLFPQVKTSKAGQITTGPLSVISSLFSGQEKEDAFVVAQRANKYITAGGEKYKQKDFDRLFEEKVKALEIGDDGKPSAAAVNQAAYDAKIQQRVNAQEDFINTLSPERKALAEALTAVREAQRAGVSIEEVNSLKQKFNDLYNIDAKKLYNFDGTYIEEGNAPDEVVAFNNQVEEGAIEKHESYTPEELEDLQVDLLYKTIFSAKKINTHKGKIFKGLGLIEGTYQQVKLDIGSLVDGESYKFGFNTGTASIATDEIRKVAETGRITETLPLLPGNSPLVQEYNNNVKQLLEVQGALALNYNPSTLEEEGYFSPLKALAVSAYETATGQDVRVADDMVKAYVSAREDAGLKVTDKDKQRAEDSILDEGMSAVGAIIPLIAEIAITKKAINLTGALKNIKILTRGAQIKSKSPYARFAIGLVSAGAQEALVFKSTGVLSEQLVSGSGEGMSGAMGFAFGVGGYAGNVITKALLGTRSPLLQGVLTPIQKSMTLRSVFNGTANATVGTGALYGAEFFDTMVNTDKGFFESVNEVLDVGGTWEMKDGKPTYTGGSPIKKLLVSFSTMGALGLGNAKGWKNMYDAMRKDIENYKPMEPSEYSKAVETLGLDPKKEYTAEEIKKARNKKIQENPRTLEELADPEKNKKAKEINLAYDKLTNDKGMLLAQEQIKKEEGYKKKKRELFFMANRMKNNIEFTGKEYELDYKDAEVIKDLSIGELEALTEDLKKQGISGQDAFTLQGKVQTARNHLKTINDVGITEPGARNRVYDLLNKFTEADRKLEELKNKSKTSKANEALFSEKIKQQEAEVKGITDNLQKEITKTEKDAVQEQTTEEGVLRLEGKEPTEQVGLQEVGQPQQKVTTEVKEEVETPTTEVEKAEKALKKAQEKLTKHIEEKPEQINFRKTLENNVERAKKFLELKKKQTVEEPQATEEVEIKTETVDTQGRPAKAGARLFNDPNPETAEISAKYKQDKGIETSAGENITELDIDNAMEIADIYEAMEDNPSDPEVQEAYNALAKETVDQYSAMTEAGYEIEIYEGKGEPYANSQEMIDDLKNNKHMYIFSTEGGFGEAGITEQQRKENAMLQDSGFKDKNGKPLLINDLFRGVHDFFGHSERGNSFGAKGEENAWDVHARMFTDKARRAMTAETRGQNSWVNFGPQMRNEKGEIIKKGEPGYLGPKERAFAPQKMGLLPESYSEITETPTTEVKEEVSKQEMEDMDRVISGDTDVQFRKKPKFRKEGTEPRDEVEADVEALLSVPDVELVNKKLDLSLVESPSVELDVADMKSRTGLRDDIDIKEVEINDFQGLPVGLTISDQLTVGDVTNPYTGNVIKNNKGGLGFGFTQGNKGLGWTYVDLKTAGNYRKYYREIYDKNPEPFDKAWEEGRLPKGHIPVFIIKMGPTSMQSNQKVFSVLADNIKKLPKKNKVAGLKALKQDLLNLKDVLTKDIERGTSIKTGKKYAQTTLDKKFEGVKTYDEILQTINKNKYKTLDELIDDVATKHKLFTLDQRKSLIGRITSGDPNIPGEAPKKPGKSKKLVSSALLEGRPKEDYPLLHLGSIMDVVTEPVTKDVPERHVIGVTAIDIFSEPVASDHPNYKGGLKGQMLGVVKNTAHLKDIYPAAYGNVVSKAFQFEEGKPSVKTEGELVSQGLATHMGLTDIPLRGQTISQRLGEREKLIGFLGQAFPATTWFTDPVTWERVLSSDGVKQYVKNGEIVYGMTRGGDIYLNPKFRDLNTPIHEAGHILLDYYEVNHPELFKKGMKLVEGTKELKEAIAELGDNVKARKEALATLIGNEGETLSEDKKKRFKEWLLQLWKALKAKFPSLRKLTPKEISNLTLEDFIGGSLKDIFSGRRITRDKVRSTERKDIDVHFRKGDNIYDVVRRLRNAGFETGKIKVALKSKGYDRKEILKAVEVPVDILRNLPESFGNIKGGVNEGIKLYESVLKEMKKPSNKKLPIEQNLDKGIEFLKKQEAFIAEGDAYKVKGEDKIKREMSTQQKQMVVDFERSVGMKSSRGLRAEVSNLKKAIRERKAGESDIKKIQSELRLFMRKTLPTTEYKKSEVTSLISKINKANKDNIDLLMDEVFDLVDKVEERNKVNLISKMYTSVKASAKSGRTISGRVTAKGRDAEGRSFFKAAAVILKAAKNNDIDAMLEISSKLADKEVEINEAIDKEFRQEPLTTKERILLDQVVAFDTFANIMEMSYDEVLELDNGLKDVKKESIRRLKENRLKEAENREKINKEADNSIFDNYSNIVYDVSKTDFIPLRGVSNEKLRESLIKEYESTPKNDIEYKIETTIKRGDKEYKISKEDGKYKITVGGPKLMTQNELSQKNRQRHDLIKKLKIFKYAKEVAKNWDANPVRMALGMLNNSLSHLGTMSESLDKTGSFFYDNVYERLNIAQEKALAGFYKNKDLVDDLANKIPGVKKKFKKQGLEGLQRKLGIKTTEITLSNNSKALITPAEMMRVYALSLNEVQKNKLVKAGYDDKVVGNIKTKLGKDVIDFVDQVVNYLSNDYYEQVNKVYVKMNNVDLPAVENYFPTVTESQYYQSDIVTGDFSKVFSSQYASALKERTDVKGDIVITDGRVDFFNALTSHFKNMEKFKSYAQPVKDINTIFNNKSVTNTLKSLGADKLMRQNILFAINPDAGKKLLPSNTEKLQARFTRFVLNFKLIQIPKQASSFIHAFEQHEAISGRNTPGLDHLSFAVGAAELILRLPKNIKLAKEISGTFRDRLESANITQLESGLNISVPIAKTKLSKAWRKAGAFGTRAGDILGVVGYMINYNRDIRNNVPKDKALIRFNDYNKTQQTRRGTEMAPIQQNPNFLMRVATMFQSTMILQYNRFFSSANNFMRSAKKGKYNTKAARGMVLNLGLANTLFSIAANLFKLAYGNDEDKEEIFYDLKKAGLGVKMLGAIPLLGSFIENFIDVEIGGKNPWGRQGGVNPYTAIYSKFKKEGPVSTDALKTLTGVILGTSVDPFIGLYNYFKDDQDNIKDVEDIMGVTKSYQASKNSTKGAKLQDLLGKPKKTNVIKDVELEDVELEDVELEDVELEDMEYED